MEPAKKFSLYDDLCSLPENLTGEILNGQLHTHPRPAPKHIQAESVLNRKIGRWYSDEIPGGWWILAEPEIHFIRKKKVCAPDLAGWRKERMPVLPETAYFEIAPDWICEILSDSTESKDRKIKMPIYAKNKVCFAWLVDPIKKTLEAFELVSGEWVEIGSFKNDDQVSIKPFDAISISLSDLWC